MMIDLIIFSAIIFSNALAAGGITEIPR